MKRSSLITMVLWACMGAMAQNPTQPSWLSDAVFYQIYPSSYQDTDGNGIGDIAGILSRLDYIKSIGVNAIWLNPVYVSGWTDGGYDVIDFYRVDKRFGTNSDLVELIHQAHARGIKIVMDLVAGHSSDQCEWFLQSKEAPNLRYSDYYIWPSFKPEGSTRPQGNGSGSLDDAVRHNASASLLSKFVATDAPRGPYYIKNFFNTQPALNFGFANPDPTHPWEQAVDAPGPMAMRRELKNIISFWMDKGVDGFRVDMAASLVKNDPDKSATIKLWKDDLMKWFGQEYPEGVLIAEWFNPAQSIEAGFDLDFFCHDGQYNYSSLFFFNTFRRPGSNAASPYFDETANAGFSTAPIEKIYIPQDTDPNRITVEKAEADPQSLLNYVRRLLKLRNEHPALGADASWRLVSSLDQPYPMVYEREFAGERCYVVINPSAKQVTATIPSESSKPQLIGGFYKKCTYKQNKSGDIINISPVSAAILKF